MKTKTFTIKEANFIAANYTKLTDKQVAEILNRKEISIRSYRWRNGLQKPRKEKKEPVARTKRIEANAKPVGAFTMKKGYKFIKTENGDWVLYNRFLWEQVNGAIPKGWIVRFKNEDRTDIRIENLEMIPRYFQNNKR